MRKSIKRLAVAAVSLTALLAIAGIATADSYTGGFEPTTFSTTWDNGGTGNPGTVDGQDGWHSAAFGQATGLPPGVTYDQQVVASSVSGFGEQSLRISNAKASGEFTYQTYSPSVAIPAGESVANKVFDATFQFTSTSSTYQPGLRISVSPDNGSGARMSYVRFDDTPGGIQATFVDEGFDGVERQFVSPTLYSRDAVHPVEFLIKTVDGPANDIVRLKIDGVDIGDQLNQCFTTWESYYRAPIADGGENHEPGVINSLEFRSSFDAGAVDGPALLGHGYLFDNVVTDARNADGPAPTVCGLKHDGLVSPTGTTCQQYHDGTAPALVGGLQYSVAKGNTIGSVSPGVFFYFTKVTVKAGGEAVSITESGAGPVIPIQQVVVYDAASCKVVNRSFTVNNTTGTAGGTLPAGSYIISVKYSPSDLKGKTAPASQPVTYSLGTSVGGVQFQADSTVVLALKAK